MFTISVIAVDQVNHLVNATIHSSLSSNLGGFSEDQSSQYISDSCSALQFNVFSPHISETLTLFPEGPCKDTVLSKGVVDILFSPCTCPIGFQSNKEKRTKCVCECDGLLNKIISECYEHNKTLMRKGTFWITPLNSTDINSNTTEYLIYPNCPLDYCYPPTSKVFFSLDEENGSDDQCNFNRSGILCGHCRSSLSLSLGSSHCIPCTKHWPSVFVLILAASFLAGIILVALLLMLNLTVATGTLNGIIFYANIINANASTFFHFQNLTLSLYLFHG